MHVDSDLASLWWPAHCCATLHSSIVRLPVLCHKLPKQLLQLPLLAVLSRLRGVHVLKLLVPAQALLLLPLPLP